MLGKCFSKSTSFSGLHSAKALFVLGFAFVLISLFVFNSSAYASTYSLGMSTSGTVSVDVSVSGNGASVTEDDLVVTSTCPLGYTITIQGPTDTTLYKDGNSANNNTTTKISPSTGTVSNPVSITGNNQGTWGYTLGNDITASSNFIGLTNAATTLITKAQQSGDGTVLTDTIPVYYGVSVQPNQVPGLYTMAESQTGAGDNVVTYFITTPTSCTSYTVSFNPTSTAGGNTLSGTGTMGSQTIPEGVATPLNPNSFTAPEGYVFKEWNTSQDGTGTSYTDGQSVTDITTVGQNLTLYAQWKPREYTITFITNNAESIVFNGVAYTNGQTTSVIAGTYHIYGNYATRYAFSSWTKTAGTFENQTYQNTAYTVTGDATITLNGRSVTTAIQNLAYASCTTTATPVYDTRDNSVYWIQKLPDNNCWMLDNLALDLTSPTIVNALSTSNTHLDTTSLAKFKDGSGTTSDRYPTAAYDIFGSTNSYSQPLTNLASKDITLMPSGANSYTNSIEGAYGQGQGKIGGYYNYCAASLGYYCFGDGTSAGASTDNNDYDACPVGWRMPTGDTAGEYNTLYTTSAINSDAATYRNALSASFSGGFSSGAAYELSSTGRFWSSTRASNNSLYYLVTRSDGINLTNSRSRDSGYSVRCINPSYYTITFKTNNATGIVFNGVTYTDGQTVKIPKDEVANKKYHIYGTYGTRYAFSSWSTTAGTFENQNYQNTAFTVTDDATITLTGQYVNTAMQNLSISNCSTTAMPVYDNRDSSVYWVQKLADGNCWMLDNMALDLTDSTIVNSLSTANTHLDATSLTYFKNGGGASSNRYPTAAYAVFGSTNSQSQPLINMDSKNITLRPISAKNYTNSFEGAYGQGQGKIGGYYNYCAASVGYYCFGDGLSAGTSSGNNAYDICPAGWRMPSGNTSGEYDALYTNASINSNTTAYLNALSVSLSGYFRDGSADHRGVVGSSWSSTRNNNNTMHFLHTTKSTITPEFYNGRIHGYSVRCINPSYYTITFYTNNAAGIVFNGVTYTNGQTVKIPKDEVANKKYHIYGTYGTRYAFSSWSTTAGTFENQNYQNTAFTVTDDAAITLTGQFVNTAMQNLSASNCTTTARPVYDNRDNTVYWIQKLPDNNCWMLDNMALDLTDSTIVNSLSTTNTHLDTTALGYFKNGGGTSSDRYPITAYGVQGSTTSYSQPLTRMSGKDTTLAPDGTTSYTGSVIGAYGRGQGKVGAYYNYCAASVGYYCFGDGSSAGTQSGNNAYDVCPVGWRIPTSGSSGEYNALYTTSAINSDIAIFNDTFSTSLSGNSLGLLGKVGDFWSSTYASPASLGHLLNAYISSNGGSFTNSGRQRKEAASVRCILGS